MSSADPACPPWCVADHSEDPRHRSAAIAIPVITSDSGGIVVGNELIAELGESPGDAHAWLYLGDGFDQRVEVSMESGARIVASLRRLLRAGTDLSAEAREDPRR